MAKSDKHVPADMVASMFNELHADLRDARFQIIKLECQLKLAEAAVMQAKLDRAAAILLTDPRNY